MLADIFKIQATKRLEFGNVGNEYPNRNITLGEVVDTIDQALQEVPHALKGALAREEHEKSKRNSWSNKAKLLLPYLADVVLCY